MVDQPGAGGSHSYKIRGHSRQRHSAKPYARPGDRKKGVIEAVKDFLSPSWLVDFWTGKSKSQEVDVEEDTNAEDRLIDTTAITQESSGRTYEVQTTGVFEGTSSNTGERSGGKVFGNGGLGTRVSSHAHGKSALSTFLASTSRYRTTRETTTIRQGENEAFTGETTRRDDVRIVSKPSTPTLGSDHVQPQAQASDNILQEPFMNAVSAEKHDSELSSASFFLNPGPSRRPLSSAFDTSTPMLGTSSTCTRSSFDTSTPVPGTSSTPLNISRTPLPSPSTSLLLFGNPTESKPHQVSAFKSKPAFSVTAFGSPLPPRPRSQGSVHPYYSSPFYSGRTAFGGAASQKSGTKRLRVACPTNVEPFQPVRKQIKPTPISGTGSGGVASQTAKRILEALERMSTPLIDAKKIPPSPPFTTSSSPLSFTQSSRKKPPAISRAVGSPRKLKAQFGAPPVQALSVPQRATISRVQAKAGFDTSCTAGTSTSNRTERTTEEASAASMFRTSITSTISKPLSSFTPTPLPMSLSPDVSTTRGGGKMKRDRSTTHYTQRMQSDEVEDTETANPLPEVTSAVPLQLPVGKLPSFSFSASPSSATTTKIDFTIPSSSVTKTSDITKNNFKFSTPAPKASSSIPTANTISTNTKVDFSFSHPAPVRKSETSTAHASTTNSSTKSTSLDKFKPAAGSWECETCLINNNASDISCVACQSPKPKPKNSSASTSLSNSSLLNRFAPPSGSWTCETCLISNKASDTKCIACQSSKPNAAGSIATKSVTFGTKGDNSSADLRKKFAPSQGSWECDICMLNNKASDEKCVSCQSSKPGVQSTTTASNCSFGAPSTSANSLAKKFTPGTGSWTCDTCLVVNKPDLVRCLACESPKPGAKVPETTGSFKLAIGNSFTSSPFKFGVDSSKDADSRVKPGFQFGVPADLKGTSGDSAPTVTFGGSSGSSEIKPYIQFGINSKGDDYEAVASTCTFGTTSGSESQAKSSLKFGADSGSAQTEGFTFGAPSSASQAKMPSIASAAAAGFLKVPDALGPSTGDGKDGSVSQGPKYCIGDAAKTAFLKIPVLGESVPPNVNLLAVGASGASSDSLKVAGPSLDKGPPTYPGLAKSESYGGTALPSLPFAFGSKSSKPAEHAKPESSGRATLPSVPFAFGAGASKPAEPTKVAPYNFTGSSGSAGVVTSGTTLGSTDLSATAIAAPQLRGFTAGLGTNTQTVGNTIMPQFNFTGATTSAAAPTQLSFTPATATSAEPPPYSFNASNSSFKFNGAVPGLAGNTSTTLTSSSHAFGFSAVSTSAPASSSSSVPDFSFAPTPATSAPGGPSAFAFSATSGSSGSQKAGFGFGSTSQPFVFGGGVTGVPSVSEESMEADGNNNSSQQAVAAPPVLAVPPGGAFGSAAAVPSTGGFQFNTPTPNTGFNFSSSQQPSSLFKFGAVQPSERSAPVAAQFPVGVGALPAFGGVTAQDPLVASGGFNFSAGTVNNMGSQLPPPAFNFGGVAGPVGAFSAGAGDSSTPGKRLIKRGVRRSRRGGP